MSKVHKSWIISDGKARDIVGVKTYIEEARIIDVNSLYNWPAKLP